MQHYFDTNATTFMPPGVIRAMVAWFNTGNPSAIYPAAVRARALIDRFRARISTICGYPGPDYAAILNSGATESNAAIIMGMALSYYRANSRPGHVVTSSIEHKSILKVLVNLKECRLVDFTMVSPDPLGFVRPEAVEAGIQDNTFLVSIMHANNETGAINPINAIRIVAQERGIVFHTDAAQTFGKIPLPPDIDAFSASFHKIHGPPGVGLLYIRKKLAGAIPALIPGAQNDGLRGGTENMPAIAGALAAFNYTYTGHEAKMNKIRAMKNHILALLAKTGVPCTPYATYLTRIAPKQLPAIEVVLISGSDGNYLPGTLLISIVKHAKSGPEICNVEIKKELMAVGVIVSIGSACNTGDPKASHVLYAIGANEKIRKGALRISFDEMTTAADAKALVTALAKAIAARI